MERQNRNRALSRILCRNRFSTKNSAYLFLLAFLLLFSTKAQQVICAAWLSSSHSVSFSSSYQRHTSISDPLLSSSFSKQPHYSSDRRLKLLVVHLNNGRSVEDKEDNGMVISEQTRCFYEGKNVLLTGASSGLGESLAIELSKCGVKTLILSARNRERLDKVAEECKRQHFSKESNGKNDCDLTTVVIPCDLSEPESVDILGKSVLQSFESGNEGIDILINNGGVSSRSRFVDTNYEVDAKVMQINFLSGVSLCKRIIPSMLSRKNNNDRIKNIIWIGSVQGLVGIPNRSSYAASKFAVQGYCESIRSELISENINVHVVSPGYINTNLSTNAVTGDGGSYNKIDPTTASGASPDDVARAVITSVARGELDLMVAASFSAKIAIWLRLLFPSLLRYILLKRYKKSLCDESSKKVD